MTARARIHPLPPDAWDAEAREVVGRNRAGVGRGGVPNILATLARYPKLLKAWYGFAAHVIGDSALPVRDREIVILRVASLCRSAYEWAQHVVMGRSAGLSDAEIARVRRGPNADGWSSADRQLLQAVDELWTTSTLENETWQALAQRYDERQTLDLLFTVGQYDLLAKVLNATGVELDDGLEGFTVEPSESPTVWAVTYRRKIRFSDADAQGIVFNPNFAVYVADTITDFFDAIGVSWETFIANGYHMVLAKCEIEYRSPARLGETLVVGARVGRVGTSSVTFDLQCWDEHSGRIVADARLAQIVVDHETLRPKPVPAFFLDAVRKIQGDLPLQPARSAASPTR
jgi:YbgC/YbaW family acyl-CoA thioester hydrolase